MVFPSIPPQTHGHWVWLFKQSLLNHYVKLMYLIWLGNCGFGLVAFVLDLATVPRIWKVAGKGQCILILADLVYPDVGSGHLGTRGTPSSTTPWCPPAARASSGSCPWTYCSSSSSSRPVRSHFSRWFSSYLVSWFWERPKKDKQLDSHVGRREVLASLQHRNYGSGLANPEEASWIFLCLLEKPKRNQCP